MAWRGEDKTGTIRITESLDRDIAKMDYLQFQFLAIEGFLASHCSFPAIESDADRPSYASLISHGTSISVILGIKGWTCGDNPYI
mgnify:CR=1 FL=1